MLQNKEKNLPQEYMKTQNNRYLQEEDYTAVITDYSSALRHKKYHVFGLEKGQTFIFNVFSIIAGFKIIKNIY